MSNVQEEEKKKKQKFKQLEKNLNSTRTNVVLSALKSLREDGNEKFIPIIIEKLVTTDEPMVRDEIIKFLNDLKSTAATPYLIEALKNKDYSDYHSVLLGVFWQSPLDASEYLSLLIEKAIEGDFMTSFEAVTVIENLEGTFTEDEIMDATYNLTEGMESAETEDKKKLLQSLQESLKKLNVEY